MVTFVNDSGIIRAVDNSISPAVETKWLKDNLRIEPYFDFVRLTSVNQNIRFSVDYNFNNVTGATSALQLAGVLLEYLEDYGGGGGGGGVTSVNAGVNISVTGTPTAPIINSLSDRYKTSSTTSNTVSNGSKSFTVDLNLSYIPLQEILIVFDPANHMHGEVVSYNPATGALVVDIKHHTGSGTYTSWQINLDGTPVDVLTGLGTPNEIAYFTAARELSSLPVANYPSLIELSYVKGVTSGIQSQINSRVPSTRNITIQGVMQDLSADRTWSFPSLPIKGGMYIEQTYITNVGPVNILWIPTVNKVYCANHANNTITIHNATTGELTNTLALTGAINLFHITQIGTPEIWAVGTGAPTVISRINITATPGGESIIGTYTGFGTIVTANEPTDYLGFSSTKAYISQIGSNSIAVVNPTTGALTATIAAVGSNPIGLAYNTNGASAMNGRVVVGVNAGLTVINETTNTVTALNVNPSSLLSTVRYVKYVSSLDMYIVASSGTQRVVFLKPASATTFTVLGSIRLNGVSDIFVDEVENICYVSHSSGQNTTNVVNLNITSIDLNTLQVLQTYYGNITGGTGSYRSKISADPASRRFFVTMLNNIANGTFIKIKY